MGVPDVDGAIEGAGGEFVGGWVECKREDRTVLTGIGADELAVGDFVLADSAVRGSGEEKFLSGEEGGDRIFSAADFVLLFAFDRARCRF